MFDGFKVLFVFRQCKVFRKSSLHFVMKFNSFNGTLAEPKLSFYSKIAQKFKLQMQILVANMNLMSSLQFNTEIAAKYHKGDAPVFSLENLERVYSIFQNV